MSEWREYPSEPRRVPDALCVEVGRMTVDDGDLRDAVCEMIQDAFNAGTEAARLYHTPASDELADLRRQLAEAERESAANKRTASANWRAFQKAEAERDELRAEVERLGAENDEQMEVITQHAREVERLRKENGDFRDVLIEIGVTMEGKAHMVDIATRALAGPPGGDRREGE